VPDEPSNPETTEARAGWFTTTHWSVVLLAGQRQSAGSDEAIEILCRRYWPPVYAFIRRRGHGPDDARSFSRGCSKKILSDQPTLRKESLARFCSRRSAAF